MQSILDLARWAPSGDNTQPWRFEVLDEQRLVVHGFDTRTHCVYDLDGRPSQTSLGALLETMSIAATVHRRSMRFERRRDVPDITPTFDVVFTDSPGIEPSPLAKAIKVRTVQRRAMQTRALEADEKAALEQAVGPRFSIRWLEGRATKWRIARLLFDNAKVRLTMPEAYEVHRSIIEWNAQFSLDRVPDAALGADALTTRLMKFVMQSWGRVDFFNRYFAGTLMPRIQMDLLPAMACSAHYVLVDSRATGSVDDQVDAGRAVQRLWLTLTTLGLAQQPEMTPLIFESYVRRKISFTRVDSVSTRAARVAGRLRDEIGVAPENAVWMARIGRGPFATARSTRLPVERLQWQGAASIPD